MPLQKTQQEPPEYGGALGANTVRRQNGCLELNRLGAESWFWRLAQRNFRLPTSGSWAPGLIVEQRTIPDLLNLCYGEDSGAIYQVTGLGRVPSMQ